ncbi:hypothetical protein HPB48_013575 [Haemaphysalis longicornis]|uniref:Uncharacterized protein n=1 Tax=Haemaphysalis longicornis TaxID=44386 RepID=A0A9J6H4H4_HAELO|nr:hypothetical protein HPB48_013575 [Haemaphysalis longicornis]
MDPEKKTEVKGKSWRREREERGRRQQAKALQAEKVEQKGPCNNVLHVAGGDGKPGKAILDAYVAELQERLNFKAELRNKNLAASGGCHCGSQIEGECKASSLGVESRSARRLCRKSCWLGRRSAELQFASLVKATGATFMTEACHSVSRWSYRISVKFLCPDYFVVGAKIFFGDPMQDVRHPDCGHRLLVPARAVRRLLDAVAGELAQGAATQEGRQAPVVRGVHAEGGPARAAEPAVLPDLGRPGEHHNLGILVSFCKHCGEDFAGLVPRRMRLLAQKYLRDIPTSDLLSAEKQRPLGALLREYYRSLCRHVLRDHKALQGLEAHNRRVLQTKGELSADQRDRHEAAHLAFHKLLAATHQLADALDEDVPDMPLEEITSLDSDAATLDIHNRFKGGELDGTTSLWEDEESRSFYESLPDLKAFIPGILFKDSVQATNTVSPSEDCAELSLEEDLQKLEMESVLEIEEEKENARLENGTKVEEKDLTETLLQEIEAPEEEPAAGAGPGAANKLLLDGFLNSLLHCVSREMVDQAAEQFCMNLNTKPNRNKLIKALFLVPRTRYGGHALSTPVAWHPGLCPVPKPSLCSVTQNGMT